MNTDLKEVRKEDMGRRKITEALGETQCRCSRQQIELRKGSEEKKQNFKNQKDVSTSNVWNIQYLRKQRQGGNGDR